ncbi:MAG: nitroreductase family deazaflavin-dependent oxidoreductase [Chloroflexi bacterium]|nr:MAG: nitroreductase family deazaflavin-dependent oxidoreductase [Chloroflexota bacterium]
MPEFSVPTQLPDWIKDHAALYIKSEGKEGHMWDSSIAGGPGPIASLLLATTGRRSGDSRTVPLIYGEADGNYIVIASRGGSKDHPDWYKNLTANPDVSVRVATDVFDAVARTAEGDEREALWQKMSEIFPPYNSYQSRTDRQIPVVVLAPVSA